MPNTLLTYDRIFSVHSFQSRPYHLQRPLSQVSLSDQSLLVGDVETTLSQRLDDSVVTQQRLGSVTLKDEAAGPAVEVCRQQEAGHRRLQMLLLILVCVEGVLQVCWDAVCIRAKEGEIVDKQFCKSFSSNMAQINL